jgi:hypothetical protein
MDVEPPRLLGRRIFVLRWPPSATTGGGPNYPRSNGSKGPPPNARERLLCGERVMRHSMLSPHNPLAGAPDSVPTSDARWYGGPVRAWIAGRKMCTMSQTRAVALGTVYCTYSTSHGTTKTLWHRVLACEYGGAPAVRALRPPRALRAPVSRLFLHFSIEKIRGGLARRPLEAYCKTLRGRV